MRFDLRRLRSEWFGNPRGDILAGLVVALALIPEAIAFSIIAGVDPKIGLYASFSMAVVISFAGGRPGMISAATGAMALVLVTLVKEHGPDHLFATTVVTGVFQMIAGWPRLGSLMRFVSRSVMTGFVNALAILIFMAQPPELIHVPSLTYVMVAGGLAIIDLFPYVTKAVPSPLISIVVLTAISIGLGLDLHTVGDMGELPSTLSDDGREREHSVQGQVFFASSEPFRASFDTRESLDRVRIDLRHAHFWNLSAIGALDAVVLKFRRQGAEVEIVGINEASATLVDRLAIHDKPDALASVPDH